MTKGSPYGGGTPDSVSTIPEADRDAWGPIPRKQRMEVGPEIIKVFRKAALPGVEVWSVRNSARLWTAYHTTYVFCVGERADCRQKWVYRRDEYAMLPRRSTLTVHPGEAHTTTLVEPVGDFHLLFVDKEVMARECVANLGARRPPCFAVPQVDDARLAKRYLRAVAAIKRSSSTPLEMEQRLIEFLETALRLGAEDRLGYPKTTHEPRAIRRVREIIMADPSSKVTLEHLADEVGLTKWHLGRVFKAHIGLPIHQFQTKVRLANAVGLLRAGLGAGEAAQSAGFADQPHLTRVMRNTLGMTPARYQQQYFRSRD